MKCRTILALRFRSAATSTLSALILAACGGSHSSTTADAGAELRVPECEDYARRAAVCFHRDDVQASVVAMAHNESERTRMGAACNINLQRLNAACR